MQVLLVLMKMPGGGVQHGNAVDPPQNEAESEAQKIAAHDEMYRWFSNRLARWKLSGAGSRYNWAGRKKGVAGNQKVSLHLFCFGRKVRCDLSGAH